MSAVHSVTLVPFYGIILHIFRNRYIYLPVRHNASLTSFELHELDKLKYRLRSRYTLLYLLLLSHDLSFSSIFLSGLRAQPKGHISHPAPFLAGYQMDAKPSWDLLLIAYNKGGCKVFLCTRPV